MTGSDIDICASSDIADGTMQAARIDGCDILLARLNGTLHALSNICPHAGAALDKGAMIDNRVVCPWHKAAFDLRTGACTAPPAVDDLVRFTVREADGRVRVRLPGHAAVPTIAPARADTRCMAIIGAGAAGAAAAQTLRQQGYAGRVVLIGREDALPYDRTILSKYALSGSHGQEKSPLQSAYFYRRHRIERRTGDVIRLDAAARRIVFADGDSLAYDAALIATGGEPRRPDVFGADLPGVCTLREAADAAAIVAMAGRRCVVLGAGFIGMEAAAALCERGLEVTVIAPQQAPFASQLGAQVGNAVAGLHRERGIRFELGRKTVAINGVGRVDGVSLDDGRTVAADVVIVGLGVSPRTGCLDAAALREDGAVRVDAGMRLGEGLYAAGDIAAFPLDGTGPEVRVEHWRVAQQQGRIAALNMLGGSARFTDAPYFWTIHFRKRLDYVGHAEAWDEVVIDGDLAGRDFLAFYLMRGVVQSVAGLGRDNQMAIASVAMNDGRCRSLAELRDALGDT